jgi:hypothetical protein
MRTLDIDKTKVKRLNPAFTPSRFCLTLEEYCGKESEEVTPVFNKPGWYSDRISGIVWHEFDGKAFIASGADYAYFNYCLMLKNHKPLADLEIQAIQTLSRRGISCPHLKQMVYEDTCWKSTRAAYRNALMTRRRIIGR